MNERAHPTPSMDEERRCRHTTKGYPSAGPEFKSIAQHRFLSTTRPKVGHDNGAKLYISKDFNFPAVDAVLVKRKSKEVVVVGIQITIAKQHSDSLAIFMRPWEFYEDQLKEPGRKVSFRFLWILEELGDSPLGGDCCRV